MIWIIVALIIVTVFLAPIMGNIVLSKKLDKEVSELFAQSKGKSNQLFAYEQLSGLPKPVQRYFKHVLKVGQPYIACTRLTHSGKFKTGLKRDWIDIKGEEYFTTEHPGFVWQGKTRMFTARDMYLNDRGRLVVSLFSLFKIVDAKGEKYDQGEILRWFGEGIWFPTTFLPRQNLQWLPIDNSTARLTFRYKGLSVYFIVTFNERDEISQMETERYMNDTRSEKWIIKLANYKEMNGVIIPTNAIVTWRLKEGDFSYADFNIDTVEYNKPSRF